MLPVLVQFNFNTPGSQMVLYLIALGLVIYAAWAGWRGAHGPVDPKTGEFTAPTQQNRIARAAIFGVIGAALAKFGLYYALPASAFLGGKGEGVPIHTYGVMIATGFILAVVLAGALAKQEWRGEEGLRKRDQVMDLAFWVLLSGLAGSRILFVIVNWKQYAENPGDLFSLGGGLVFYGGLIGATIAGYVYTRVYKIEFFRLADLAMPTVSLGQCFGRLGCFSAGCCWGDVTKEGFLFGAKFPGAGLAKNLFGQLSGVSSLAADSMSKDTRWVNPATGQIFHSHTPGDGLVQISQWVHEHGHTLPVHPTQIYESIGQFSLMLILLFMRRYRRFHGQIFALWLMCYAVLRTTVELFRGDVERGTLHGLLESLHLDALASAVPLEAWYNISTSQFISICMFTLGATILYRKVRAVTASSSTGGGVTTAPAAA
ncbi:MAG: prolipoprotein diacylglyceryl transferase [Myxococcaceae bacterium]|nr:prolipoprotein diacylglyceryl transferase [Myxococcaceae bacterium]